MLSLFSCLLAICMSSLEKYLFRPPAHLLTWLVIFLDIDLHKLCIFWRLTHVHCIICKYFLQFCKLSSQFVYGLIFNVIQNKFKSTLIFYSHCGKCGTKDNFVIIRELQTSQTRSDQISRSVMSDSLRPHESQHARHPVQHQFPEFTQTQVHRVSYAIQLSHPLSSPSPPAPNPSQHQSLFQ